MGSILYNFYIKDLEKKTRRKDIEQYISTRMSRNVKKQSQENSTEDPEMVRDRECMKVVEKFKLGKAFSETRKQMVSANYVWWVNKKKMVK